MRAASGGTAVRPAAGPVAAAVGSLARSLALWLGLVTAPAVAQDEVPFITTPDRVTLAMLELAGVGPGDHVIDLGSGDGRIVVTAARRFGASGLGVEIVPDLVRRSRENARLAGVQERVEFREQDLFATDLGRASVITMYLLPEVNLQLRPRLLALAPGTRIVSHDWDLGDWRPDRSVTLEVPEKMIGREKSSTVHYWRVPAQVHGRWCAPGASLDIVQRFQRFSASLDATARAGASGAADAPAWVFDGRIDATTLRGEGSASAARLELDGARLQLREIGSAGAALQGRVFERASAAGCR